MLFPVLVYPSQLNPRVTHPSDSHDISSCVISTYGVQGPVLSIRHLLQSPHQSQEELGQPWDLRHRLYTDGSHSCIFSPAFSPKFQTQLSNRLLHNSGLPDPQPCPLTVSPLSGWQRYHSICSGPGPWCQP